MTVKGLLIVIYLDLVLPAAVILNIYLYFYPVLYACAFPAPPPSLSASLEAPAPIRLLTLADPQLEGDSSLRRYTRPARTTPAATLLGRLDDYAADTRLFLHRARKTLDLWGNDLYLAHVYARVRKFTYPTHVAVLGDLLGSQWIDDAEFQRRADRFWHILGANASRVTDEDLAAAAAGSATGAGWSQKVLAVAGNHDIGYAGDMTAARLGRFREMFGPLNYVLRVEPGNATAAAGKSTDLRIVVLNNMVLDTPIADASLAEETYALLENELEGGGTADDEEGSGTTLLLTHVPLHKPAGVCVDAPEVTYFNSGAIRSQNMLSPDSSARLLRAVRGGVVMTGHDHEGCKVLHTLHPETGWNATRHDGRGLPNKTDRSSVREITVRSMMGEFGGNVGLLSAWWDDESAGWEFGYSYCALGVQHLWWATHSVNLVCLIVGVVLAFAHMIDSARNQEKAAKLQEMLDKKEQ